MSSSYELRYYLDLLNENEQVQHLDEGFVQDLKTKASNIMGQLKSIPGIGQAYQKAKALAPQLKQIFLSAKSGKELLDGIKRLVTPQSGAQTIKEINSARVGGTIGLVGGMSISLYEILTGFMDSLVAAVQSGGPEHAAALWFIVMPLLCMVAGAFLLWHDSNQR